MLKRLLFTLLIILNVCAIMPAPGVQAVSVQQGLGVDGSDSEACKSFQGTKPPGCKDPDRQTETLADPGGYLNKLINTFLYAAGIVSFIFVLVSGFRFITSTGNPADIKKAKDTLIYALAGLIVALLSFGIVNFIVFKVS